MYDGLLTYQALDVEVDGPLESTVETLRLDRQLSDVIGTVVVAVAADGSWDSVAECSTLAGVWVRLAGWISTAAATGGTSGTDVEAPTLDGPNWASISAKVTCPRTVARRRGFLLRLASRSTESGSRVGWAGISFADVIVAVISIESRDWIAVTVNPWRGDEFDAPFATGDMVGKEVLRTGDGVFGKTNAPWQTDCEVMETDCDCGAVNTWVFVVDFGEDWLRPRIPFKSLASRTSQFAPIRVRAEEEPWRVITRLLKGDSWRFEVSAWTVSLALVVLFVTMVKSGSGVL